MDTLMARHLMQPKQNYQHQISTNKVLCCWYISARIKQKELRKVKGGK
jgi:hypothetical protein